jgi:anaerobic C4-dicarboxylate transporter
MQPTTDERSLGELFTELTQEARTLVQQEIALAKTELSQKAAVVGRDIAFLAAGAAVAYAGLLAILAAIIIGLATIMPAWLAALLVGIIVAGLGYLLVQKGQSDLKRQNLMPHQTIQTLKEDSEWMKEQLT